MATLLSDELTHVSFPIKKWEEDKDGNLVVYGTVTDNTLDSDKQIVDSGWSAKALQTWMSSGPNVRVMHSPTLLPAGRGLKVELGDNAHQLKALVVEDQAKRLVKNRVLRAYSVGIANPVIQRDAAAPGGRIVGGELMEVSLVDRPANKNCGLVLAKSADLDVPWTYGDLQKQLAKAEKATRKHDDLRETYEAERADWLAREPRLSAHSAMTGTAFLAKMAARDQWQTWSHEGDQHGYGSLSAWLAKRDVRPEVGGGVDVDTMPAEDFIDPQRRRFPIHTPADVPDAVSSYGRARPQIPMKRFRRRLISIARRKGPEFVARLPESWHVEKVEKAVKNITTTQPLSSGLVPFNLQGQGRNDKDDVAEPDLTKGVSCTHCGEVGTAGKRCRGCGRKIPTTVKSSGVPVRKRNKKRRPLPSSVRPAGQHREPDGGVVEAFERDAGLPTALDRYPDDIPDSVKGGSPFPGAAPPFGKKPRKKPARSEFTGYLDDEPDDEPEYIGDLDLDSESPATKTVSDPYTVKRLHDALCAAYDWRDVAATYPAMASVADALTGKAFSGALGDDVAALRRAHSAKVLNRARRQIRKTFTDAYPNVSLHPATQITPGQFRRPYIQVGRAPLNATGGVPVEAPAATHVPSPTQFHRDLITAGHQAGSPSAAGNNNPVLPTTGSGRDIYAGAAKVAAVNALAALHDHIAATSPDTCPMAPSRHVMPADLHATARPTRSSGLTVPPVPGAAVTKSRKKKAKERRRDIRKAVRTAVTKAAKSYDSTIAEMQNEIDRLGAQPDPAQAPLRGVVRTATTPKVEKVQADPASNAVREEVEFLRPFLNHPNPAMREQAEDRLRRLIPATH